MNFKNMPELNTQCGYFVVVGIIALLCTVLYLRFKTRSMALILAARRFAELGVIHRSHRGQMSAVESKADLARMAAQSGHWPK
jgi:hypothetical protein